MADQLPQFTTLTTAREPGDVLVVTLNRPDARNAVNRAMHDELLQLLVALRSLEGVGAVVLTGAGKVFCAGGDVEMIDGFAAGGWSAATRLAEESLTLVRDFLTVRPPVIAAVNGHAMGLGATLALLCDIVVMADDAMIADTHINVGIMPGDGGTALWPALVGPARAKELLMTGDSVKAADAERIGLVNHVVHRAEVVSTAMTIATRLASGPRQAIAWTKQAVNAAIIRDCSLQMPLSLALESQTLMQPDLQEGLAAFRERRAPNWPSVNAGAEVR
ncbi:MAG TPA: enoyl-CoA hydratase/isomerase family protein [Ilumatobacteraceae bacterium]